MLSRIKCWSWVVALAAVLLVPAAANAQPRPVGQELTAQDRKMLELANECSRQLTVVMEKWVDSRETTEKRLFAALYYPVADTDPPKFNTDWDNLSDRDVAPIQELYLGKMPRLIFVTLVDRHGYVPTHNARFSQTLTGNRAVDLVNNRTKRMFNDRTGIMAARNVEPFILQKYRRDTGEILKDLAVPVFVKGKHWGAVRFAYEELAEL